jgi:hypothetical protein
MIFNACLNIRRKYNKQVSSSSEKKGAKVGGGGE